MVGGSQYQVIGSVPDKYAVVYGCTDYILYHVYWAQILSRSPWLDGYNYGRALDSLKAVGYDYDKEFADGMGKDCEQGVRG